LKSPASSSQAQLYLDGSRLGLAKIGVAPDPSSGCGKLQVGSPVKLELALAAPYAQGRETPAEQRARKRGASGRRR
jgi:hypothetical protein